MNFAIYLQKTDWGLLTKKSLPNARVEDSFWFVLRAGFVMISFGW